MLTEHRDHTQAWSAFVAIVMLLTGCACFILSVIAAMVVTNKSKI